MHLGKCVFSIDVHLERCIFNRNMHLPRCKSMKINRDGDEIRLKTMVKGQKKRVIPYTEITRLSYLRQENSDDFYIQIYLLQGRLPITKRSSPPLRMSSWEMVRRR